MSKIKISYLIVFISLVFWASFAFFTMGEQISNQKVYAKLINVSGKQRMLSQKTTLIAKRIYETNDNELVEHFVLLVNLMKKDHQFMLDNVTSKRIHNVYYSTPYNLDNKVKEYFKLLDRFYKNRDLNTLKKIENYSFSLLGKLNYVVNEFEKESDINTDGLMQRELFIFLGTLLTLILEAVFLFIPTVKKLQNSKDEVEKFNKVLEETVKEQKEIILKEQKEKKEKEKQASLADMITNITHQWRQPLSVISTGASGMKIEKEYGLLKDENFYKICDTITENAEFLSKTINDFNDLQNKKKVEETCNLNDTIGNILELTNDMMTSHEIKMVTKIDKEIIIKGCGNELSSCLMNILTNAKDALIANTYSNRIIIMTIENINNEATISIKDNGGGIKEEILSKIFDPYFTTNHQTQGKGLGLYLVYNSVVQIMQGNINAKSIELVHQDEIYKGSEFIVTLPM